MWPVPWGRGFRWLSAVCCTAALLAGLSAGYAFASDGPEPLPMPEGGGVVSEWRCRDWPIPDPTATTTTTTTPEPYETGDPPETVTPEPVVSVLVEPTPTATVERCVARGWSALPPSPTPTSTVTVTPEPVTVDLADSPVTLAPGTFDLDGPGGPLLFLVGVLVMVGLVMLIWKVSAPPSFGVRMMGRGRRG